MRNLLSRFSGIATLLILAVQSAPLRAQVLSTDLVYTTIEPCRIVDTRADGGEEFSSLG